MIDLNELQFFVSICEAQSFTVAARALGVPKSSVSRALSRLESRLGVRLVTRTTRSMTLTEAGVLYLERCRHLLDELEQADLLIGAMHAKPRGMLRVAASVPFTRFVLGPMLADFLAAYPEIRVHLQPLEGEGRSRAGRADIVIRPGPLEDSDLLARALMQIRLAIYASPAYLAGRCTPRTPADLREHHTIAAVCGEPGLPVDAALWRLRRGAASQEVKLAPRVIVADPTISYQLALTGGGIALLNQKATRADVEAGRLVRLLPDWEPEPVELFAVYGSRLNASPKVCAFLDFLRERFNDESGALGQMTPRLFDRRRSTSSTETAASPKRVVAL